MIWIWLPSKHFIRLRKSITQLLSVQNKDVSVTEPKFQINELTKEDEKEINEEVERLKVKYKLKRK